MANNNINFYVIANTSSADSAIDKMYNRAQKLFSKPLKPDIDTNALNKSLQPLGKFSSNFKEFEKSLDAATARVVAFTATTGLIYGLGNAFKRLTSDAIQVEAAVARIQGILKASDKDLASFTDSIFKLANNTGQGFYDAAKAAEEFARQGLSLQQTLKATESALILTRLSGSSLEETINGLVATVSSFSNELLDYGKVVNTLASIDAKFSTSAAGLVEGIKRVGSVASDAGVSFEELSSSIAAIRQITGRSESVIGNGLKTIFTNLQTEKVQQELAKLGIQTQKSTGEFLPLINVIDQLADAFQNLNDSQRADLGQKVAGKYQINTFKALIQSFGGKDTSLFDQALQTAKGAQDEAIRRNELLNKTTLSTLNQLNNSITALGASFGDKVGKPLVDTLAKAANQGLEVLTGVFKDNPIGDFITGGIVSALKGPGIILAGVALAKLTKRIVFELTDAVKSVGGLNSRTQQNLKLDEAITNALKKGNAERVRAINLATTLEEKQREINALLRESYPTKNRSTQLNSPLATLVDKDTRKQVLKSVSRNAANGIMPAVAKEQSSIYNGVGGARKTARPVIANINMAGGSTPVVVNTDEHIIRNFANTGKDAVFNRNMTRQAGGDQSLGRFGNVEKVMAAGYTPRVKGVTPSILEAPFTPTSGETFGLDPRKLDFIRKITENVTGARTKPVRFRKNLENYGEFWPDSNNVLVNPKVISDKSPYYGGYSVPAHEYGHFMEYNSDPALMDLFKSAYKFDVKKKGSLFNQMYKKIGSGAGYSKKNYFSESFADTFAYSFLDRRDREPALGGRAMSDLMRELIMNNIPVKSKANGFIPNFARRSRFQEKDDKFFDLLNGLDLDNIGYTPGTGNGLSDRTVKRGSNQDSFTRFTADRKNRIIRIEDTESYQKGDAFKNYSAIADFAKRKDFIVKSAAFVKQGSRDNTKDKGISLLYKLFPQLRYRDGVTRNTSGKYHIGRSERKFSSLYDLKSQIGQLGDSHIRSISKFSDIQDNFADGLIPNFAFSCKRYINKGQDPGSLLSFHVNKKDKQIKIAHIASQQKGDAFKNFSAIADFARKRNFTISSECLIKQDRSIDPNGSPVDNLYKLFPQLKYRDGVTKNTSGRYSTQGDKSTLFSSLDDLKNQVSNMSVQDIRNMYVGDLEDTFAGGIIPNFAIDKSVYRHYYKQLKRKLRSSKATYDLSGYGFWDHMGKSNKSTTLYRGTDYQEVEKLLNGGKFSSNWRDGSGATGTFVSASMNYGRQYARDAHARTGAGYMLALNKNIAGKDRERSVRHAMGNVATNMAISGDVLDSDVKAILQYDETKKGRLRPLPLGDLILKDTKAFKGSVPNFAKPQKLGEGYYGTFHRLKNNIGVKKLKEDFYHNTPNEIADEYKMAKYLSEHTKLPPGVEIPKVYGSLERSVQKRRIGRSIFNGETLKNIGLSSEEVDSISQGLKRALTKIGVWPDDLSEDNLMVNEKGSGLLIKYRKLLREVDGNKTWPPIWNPRSKLLKDNHFETIASAFARRGGRISIVDSGRFRYRRSKDNDILNPDYGRLKDKLAAKRDLNYADGIVPNFANPLKDSISREYDALSDMGYPSYVAKNSIKVGSHDRLKSGNNPNGLGVYNTAQGQMSLGQALGQHAGQSLSSGIVPNFADLKTSTEKVSSKNLGLLIISTKRLNNTFSSLDDYLSTSFLSSLRKTTGSIIDISDAANTKYKGIIDPTNIPSNKNAALLDPTGQAYGQSETARRLGLPIPTPVSQVGISSNILGLPSSLKSGKSVNYKDFKDTPISSALLSLDVTSERKREAEAKRKSDKAVNEYIRNGINKSSPYGGKISPAQQKIRFTPNDMSETVKRLGLPMPTPIVKGGISSPIAELPPSLRDGTRQAGNIQIPTTQTTIERLGLPAPTPVKNNPPVVPKPQPVIKERLSYKELVNTQISTIARGLNLDIDAERKREADLRKKNNDAIDKQIKTKIEEDNLEKQLRKEARTEERKKRIEFLAKKKVSNLQYGGPQEKLDSTIERLEKSKSLDPEFVSNLKEVFEKRQEKAFTQLSSQTGIFTSNKKLNSVAKKLNISTSSEKFLQRREEIKQKRQNAMQTGAFALPFVTGGIANSVGGQDTRAGRVTSGLGEAAGTALLLSQFGPLGIAAGAAVGTFQVLSTVVKELTPDLNELSKKSRELSAANEREISSLQSFIQSTSQLKSLVDSNSSPSTIAQAKISLSESTRGLSGNSGLKLLRASTDEERTSIIQDVTLANQRKQALTDVNLLAGGIINEKASGVYNNLDRIGFNRRQLLDVGNTQTIANEIVKTIDLSKISNETVSKAKSGTASLKDLGLDNAEISKLFSDTNKFFSDGTVKTTGASDQILKFVQSLVVAQKSLDELSSRQVDTAKIFASTKESFLNILTGTFAQNQSANKNLISGNEIGFSKAETILAKLSQSLSPEELLKGSVKIKQAKIDQDFASQKISISNEYTNKILEDILSQASGTSLQDQIKIQDALNKSITGSSPFDPLKLTGEIQGILGSDATKSLQSQLLKTSIEIAAKMEDSKNDLKKVQEELANQTEIEQKQLSDTRLINLFGGFNSNFRDVLRSIKQPKGGLTTRGNLSGLNAGDVSNLGSAKPGTIDAVDKSQRNVEIVKNRSELFSDIQLPEDVRKKINKTNYNDLYLAGKSNIENRALAFGQQEIIPQFDILKSKIAGKDTGSFGRKAIDKQLEAIKKSFSIGQVADIKPEFVKTIQSLIPTADRDGSIQKALDAILNNSEIVQGIFSSADSSAKALAEGSIKGEKLPPEFEAQITAIGNNTNILLKNTASLDKLEGVLRDLPFQIKDLREKSTKQIQAFGISKQMETLQADTAFKASTLERAINADVILKGIKTQARRTTEDNKYNPLDLSMDESQMTDFLRFEGQSKLPSSPSELDNALKDYISKKYPTTSQYNKDKTFQRYSDDTSYQQLSSAISKDSGLLYSGAERDVKTLNEEIISNTKKIEELKRELEKLNSNTKVQSNNTTPVPPTVTQSNPTVNISFNGVGSVDPNKVKEAVYSALANINRENNLPPPIQRPVSNTLVA